MIAIDNIYNVDCLAGMKQMVADSVDLVITSPPYNFGLRLHTGKYTRWTPGETFGYTGLPANRYDNRMRDALSMDDYYAWQCQCIDEMLRVSKGPVFYNIMMITGNKVALLKLMGHYSDHIREILIWDKMSSEPAMHEGVLNREFEFVIVFDKHDCKGCQFPVMNAERGTLSNVLRIGKNRSTKHRAAFPVLLPQTLIHYLAPQGGVILDPFLGSGTTAIAAIKEDRHYIGFEINEEYFYDAEKRIKEEKSQLKLAL